MKKILAILMSVMLYATNLPYNTQNIKNIPQREVKTKKDFQDFEKTLKEAISLGDYSKALVLGLLYLQKYPFHKAEPKKAIYYLNLALNHNVSLAALTLSYLIPPIKAIEALDKGINAASNIKTQKLLAIREVEIVLNDLYFNKEVVKHTIKVTHPILKQTNDPVLEFGVAHLFFILKDINTANYYINKACTSNKATNDLKTLCKQDPFLKKIK